MKALPTVWKKISLLQQSDIATLCSLYNINRQELKMTDEVVTFGSEIVLTDMDNFRLDLWAGMPYLVRVQEPDSKVSIEIISSTISYMIF